MGETTCRNVIKLKLPKVCAHKYHIISKESGLARRLRPELKEKVAEYVQQGIVKASMVKHLIQVHVESTTSNIPENDRAYHPTSRDVQNYVRSALAGSQHSDIDQDNLKKKIAKW